MSAHSLNFYKMNNMQDLTQNAFLNTQNDVCNTIRPCLVPGNYRQYEARVTFKTWHLIRAQGLDRCCHSSEIHFLTQGHHMHSAKAEKSGADVGSSAKRCGATLTYITCCALLPKPQITAARAQNNKCGSSAAIVKWTVSKSLNMFISYCSVYSIA